MKSIEVKDNTYIDSIKEVNDKDTKFKVLLKDILQIGLK